MADTKKTESAPAAAAAGTDQDRVVALSINKDGAPDQSPDFVVIGDKDAAVEATKRQFAEIAVSAVDAQKRAELGLAGTADGDTSDAAIDALRAEHDKVAASAEKQAEAIINAHAESAK